VRRLRPFTALCLIACALVLGAGGAQAKASALSDCIANGRLTEQYTIPQLHGAIDSMTATQVEYTGCRTILQTQLYKQLAVVTATTTTTGGDASGGGGSGTTVLIIVVAVILVAGVGFALVARGRGTGGGGTPPTAAGS